MIKVNLVPAEILAKARQRQLMMQATLVGGVLAVVVVLASFMHLLGLHNLKSDLAVKQSKLKKFEAIVKQVDDLEAEKKAVSGRLGVIEGLLKGGAFYPVFMSEFASTVPSGVRVTNLSTVTQPNSSVKLTITASAGTNDDIAAWVRTLQGAPHFASVELGAVNSSGANQYSFTLATVYTVKL